MQNFINKIFIFSLTVVTLLLLLFFIPVNSGTLHCLTTLFRLCSFLRLANCGTTAYRSLPQLTTLYHKSLLFSLLTFLLYFLHSLSSPTLHTNNLPQFHHTHHNSTTPHHTIPQNTAEKEQG